MFTLFLPRQVNQWLTWLETAEEEESEDEADWETKQKHHGVEDQPYLLITLAFPLLNSMLNLTTTTWHSAASVLQI